MGMTTHTLREVRPPGTLPVRFRSATALDLEAIGELIYGHTPIELVPVIGNDERALAFGNVLAAAAAAAQVWTHTVVVELNGRAIGVLVWRAGTDSRAGITPQLAWRTLRALGLRGALRVVRFEMLQRRLSPAVPPDAYYIAEIHVAPAWRGQGIGGQIMAHAEFCARTKGMPRMALTTSTSNPARRLYERCGFRVVDTYTDPTYERLTGVAGRHLMVKDLFA